MTAEAAGHNQSTREALPQGVATRQSWQPIATQKAGVLMTGIGLRTAPMLENVLRISDWYEQFTRRVQPWSGWTAMPLEFRRMDGQPQEIESPKGSDVANSEVAATFAVPATGLQPRTTEMHWVEPPTALPAIAAQRLSRPAIRLSTLRIIRANTLAQPHPNDRTRVSQKSSSTLPVDQLAVGDRPFSAAFPSAEQPQMLPRLALSIAPNPRREVQGGFPARSLPGIASEQPQARGASGSFRQPAFPVAPLPADSEPVSARITVPSDVPAIAAQVVSPETPGPIDEESAIAKLIANSFLPVPMPGLEIRLASPATQEERYQSTKPVDHSPSPSIPPSPPPPTPTPQLNINEIADKVYQTLQRRQQFERERRGLH